MSNQKWADACTTNCVWLLQQRYIPFSDEGVEYDEEGQKIYPHQYDQFEPENIPDEACWNTVAVALTRHEVYEMAARRLYHYGRENIDWRIYGVPAVGLLVDKLSEQGVDQKFIDDEVENYKKIRSEYESARAKRASEQSSS